MSINLDQRSFDIISKTKIQRLRRLKQLATAHWVRLGAAHTRFEHSISIAYLAGHMPKNLQKIARTEYYRASDMVDTIGRTFT